MRLEQLTIERFKGVSHMELDLRGKSADIYGDNATGKTTIADAVTWLLFDKDTDGRKVFSVKPLNADGTVKEPGAETSVEGMFTQDGKTIALRKTYREVWARKRGSAQAELTGNTSDYYLNGVPTTARAYAQAIDAMIPAALVPMLSDPTYFARTLEWKKRRAVLLEMAGDVEDADVAAQDEAFAELLQRANGMDVADLLAVLRADRRKTNDELSKIPARIDELTQLKEEEPANLDMLQESMEAARRKIAALKDPKNAELDEALRAAMTAQAKADRDYMEFQREENERLRGEQEKIRAQRAPLLFEQNRLQEDLRAKQRDADRLAMEREHLAKRMEELRERFSEVSERQWAGDEICPTCGQALPEETVQKSRARFEKKKDEELAAINLSGTQMKERAAAAEEEQAVVELDVVKIKKKLLDAETALDGTMGMPQHAEGYEARLEALKVACTAARQETERLQKARSGNALENAQELKTAQELLRKMEQAAQIPARNAQIDARLAALGERQKELGAMLAECDVLTEAAERFGREKCRVLQKRIDALFDGVTWRLWREQINGGMTDCCDALIDGVPFEDANNAAKINAGMAIVAALARHYGREMPVFVDNAEAVTDLREGADLQVIRLVVSEEDKTLRVWQEEV